MTNTPITYLHSENSGLRETCKTNNKQQTEL